jgi:hypothetical protein
MLKNLIVGVSLCQLSGFGLEQDQCGGEPEVWPGAHQQVSREPAQGQQRVCGRRHLPQLLCVSHTPICTVDPVFDM